MKKNNKKIKRLVFASIATLMICFVGTYAWFVGMKTVNVSLNSIDKVKDFVNEVAKYNAEFDLVSGRYVIDAKSIMGIFSLDLSKPIELNIHSEEGNIDDIVESLKPFIID